LSAGQRRRLALARLLAAPRPIWLLDEPTAALDVSGKEVLVGMIEEHRATGGMVIAATHLELELDEAREIFISSGRAV
jgi:heme exporter protein A